MLLIEPCTGCPPALCGAALRASSNISPSCTSVATSPGRGARRVGSERFQFGVSGDPPPCWRTRWSFVLERGGVDIDSVCPDLYKVTGSGCYASRPTLSTSAGSRCGRLLLCRYRVRAKQSRFCARSTTIRIRATTTVSFLLPSPAERNRSR